MKHIKNYLMLMVGISAIGVNGTLVDVKLVNRQINTIESRYINKETDRLTQRLQEGLNMHGRANPICDGIDISYLDNQRQRVRDEEAYRIADEDMPSEVKQIFHDEIDDLTDIFGEGGFCYENLLYHAINQYNHEQVENLVEIFGDSGFTSKPLRQVLHEEAVSVMDDLKEIFGDGYFNYRELSNYTEIEIEEQDKKSHSTEVDTQEGSSPSSSSSAQSNAEEIGRSWYDWGLGLLENCFPFLSSNP